MTDQGAFRNRGQASARTVSVIIPTNRGGPYLEEAVASVRAQTVPVDEIVLVDDGSPEPGLADLADRLGLRYIHQVASGLSVARNTGAAAARGDWIAYLDDDDVWHPERIAAQLDALVAMPDAVAACTGGWYMDSEGARFGTDWRARPATSARMLAYDVPPPRITTLLIRRTAYDAAGGCRSEMEPAEDNDLILRLLQIGEIACVDRALVGYRRHGANITVRGLAGRDANRRVIRDQLRRARARGDERTALQLVKHRRVFRRYAAVDNLGEWLDAVGRREYGYALGIVRWGVHRAPLESIAAVLNRVRRRGA